jgi:hypothetical protein
MGLRKASSRVLLPDALHAVKLALADEGQPRALSPHLLTWLLAQDEREAVLAASDHHDF